MHSAPTILAQARQKRLRVQRPQGQPEGRAKRVIQWFQRNIQLAGGGNGIILHADVAAQA